MKSLSGQLIKKIKNYRREHRDLDYIYLGLLVNITPHKRYIRKVVVVEDISKVPKIPFNTNTNSFYTFERIDCEDKLLIKKKIRKIVSETTLYLRENS